MSSASKRNYKNFILEFIQVYRSLPALWKVRSVEYSDRNKKLKSYEILHQKYKEKFPDATIDDVKKKINSLRTNFKKELKKRCNSQKSGVATDEVYESSQWYFEDMLFLSDQGTPSVSKNCIYIKEEGVDNGTQLSKMPKKCFVPGCSTGYDSNKAAQAELAARGEPISIFLFPKDDSIRMQWLQNISRDAEDKPQAKRYVCSLHFKDTDYKTSKVCRGTERQVRSLKNGAVPTVFNNASYPSYMKYTDIKERTITNSMSVARREGVWTEYEQETEAWLASDFNLEDLKEKGNVEKVGPSTSHQPKPTSKRKRDDDQRNELLISLACKRLSELEDENAVLGKMWAHELSKMEREQQIFAKKAINEILFEGQMGTLHRHSVHINVLPSQCRFITVTESPISPVMSDISGQSNS